MRVKPAEDVVVSFVIESSISVKQNLKSVAMNCDRVKFVDNDYKKSQSQLVWF